MKLYGIANSLLAKYCTKELKINCPNCNNNQVQLMLFGSYFMVFFLPIFPWKKHVQATCNSCNQTIEPNALTDALNPIKQQLISKHKFPLWYSSGLAIIIISLIGYGISLNKHQKEVIHYITNPLKNDVYHIKTKEGDYTLFKVNRVTEDSVFVLLNNYKTTYKIGVETLNEKERYSKEVYGFSKNNIKSLYQTQELIDVTRE